jgi:sugar phosphate permease
MKVFFLSNYSVGGIVTGLPLSVVANYYSWSFSFMLIELLCIFGVILQVVVPKMSRKLKIE